MPAWFSRLKEIILLGEYLTKNALDRINIKTRMKNFLKGVFNLNLLSIVIT